MALFTSMTMSNHYYLVARKIDQAGEVISDGVSAINPMNWAW